LNYGLFSAVLLAKLALSKLKKLETEREVPMYPILGVGSMPFRGHLSPENCERFLNEYKGLSTVTVQSALKYDCHPERAKQVVSILNERLPNGEPAQIEPYEEETLHKILKKASSEYEGAVEEFAPLVNSIASYVPNRRARKLHIGLFGYSRSVKGVALPRAIPFAAAFYSLGIPPEFLGGKFLKELKDGEWDLLQKYYINMKNDLNTAGGYISWQNINLIKDMQKEVAIRAGMSEEKLKIAVTKLSNDLESIERCLGTKLGARTLIHRKHENFTNNFLIAYVEHDDNDASNYLLEAAKLREGLG
ncbi:MAG: phosphoenolpyruvate carboxylase, partial [Candidatus Bathyarchaeota archaeon]